MRRIAVVTGTRAEWGLLRPACEAIRREPLLELRVVAGGAHLLEPARTIDEVRAFDPDLSEFRMQVEGESGRAADARAFGRGVTDLCAVFSALDPEIVLVLGDRIEAFAAASAAAIAGIRVAHLHGGDRAEGVADESMRHAITKLAHIHFPASAESAQRILRLGEHAATVHPVGSTALDGLAAAPMIDDDAYARLGRPEFVFLMHPCGRTDSTEQRDAAEALEAALAFGRVLALSPNTDPGRNGIARAIIERRDRLAIADHLPRQQFIGLLKRPEVKALVGNSSAGIIEASAIGKRVIDIGTRQRGRERGSNVTNCAVAEATRVVESIAVALECEPKPSPLYGTGDAGARIARRLAELDLDRHPVAKLNSY